MRLVVEAMTLEDISQVLDVDRESYTLPWPASAYRREIMHNRNARYLVLREKTGSPEGATPERDEPKVRSPLGFFRWTARTPQPSLDATDRIIGYAGMWLMIDEAHVTTIAMRTEWRGKGLGELLLLSLIEAAIDIGIRRVTLEVRVSNETAQRLYRKYGFSQEGMRTRYYSDNNEDAYIMTTSNIQEMGYRSNFSELGALLRKRFGDVNEWDVDAPALTGMSDATVGTAD